MNQKTNAYESKVNGLVFDVECGTEAERYLNAPTDQAFVQPEEAAAKEQKPAEQKQAKGNKAKVEVE